MAVCFNLITNIVNELIQTTMRKPFFYLCIALICCAACSNDPEVNLEPQAPRLNVNDSLAIVDIWEKADGKNWFNKWDLKDFWTWGGAGIILDKEKNEYRIVKLDINIPAGNNVNGIISSKIGELTELRWLQIGNRGIKGKIPSSIQNLKKMENLSIAFTDITDTIPNYFFSFEKLRELEVSDNKGITGNIPSSILNCPSTITSLRLGYNNLSGEIPLGINTDHVLLDGNNFSSFPFEYLEDNTSIIYLRENKIQGFIPDSILNSPEKLTKLKLLTLNPKEGYGFENAPSDW